MKKIKSDFRLIFILIGGIAVGILLGVLSQKLTLMDGKLSSIGFGMIQTLGSIKHILGQIIFFMVPLIIIGFVAPSITRLGKNANKILGFAVIANYISSVGAALFAVFVGFLLIPMLNIPTSVDGLVELPKLLFKLDIPAIMPVMSALFFAIMIGIATLLTKSATFEKLLSELENIMLWIVNKIVVPVLPFFIMTTFAQLAYEGGITRQLPVFLQIVIIAIVCHFIWMSVLYSLGGIIAKRNPWEVVKHYGPAYLTALGTMSSAATLSVALKCAGKSKVLSKNIVDFIIPVGATMHLCGSALTETLFCITIYYITHGVLPDFGTMFLFVMLLGVFAVGAPGVPGGTVMASLGIVIAILGFDESMIALLLAIFALQDSFGTACNVTSDGAVALMAEGVFNPEAKNLQTQE